MTPLADVRAEWHGETPVAAVHGEVDASNVARDRRRAAQRWSRTVRPSSSSTSRPRSYLDSAGINLLFALGDELRARQLALRLVVIARQSPIARMLAITSLDQAQPTYPDVALGRLSG